MISLSSLLITVSFVMGQPVFAQQKNTQSAVGYATQQQAITMMIDAFNKVPSFPAKLPQKPPKYSLYFYGENVAYNKHPRNFPRFKPLNEYAWLGLKAAFPKNTPSQWPSLLGMTTTTPKAPVTAGQVATWVQNWGKKARNTFPGYEGMPTSAYQLMTDFTFWYGTDVKSPSTKLTVADLKAIGQNLMDSALGYRMLNHSTIEFLPVIGWTEFPRQVLSYANAYFKTFDQGITLTFKANGTAIYHRPYTNGFDIDIGQGGSPKNLIDIAFDNGFNGMLAPAGPKPIFNGVVNKTITTGKQGTIPYMGGLLVTPTTWANPMIGEEGGGYFYGVIHYNQGKITWIYSYGYQLSPYGGI